jgi:hypothetical protein
MARSHVLISVFLFLVSVCILSARNFMNNELGIIRDTVNSSPELEPAINPRWGDMPIPRRPPGFSIGPADAGI